MRDIEFRAWDSNQEAFIYSTDEPKDNPASDGESYWRFENGVLKAYVCCTETPSDLMEAPFPSSYEVDGDIEQYTGLKDKNGVKIYGGDQTTSLDRDGHVVTSTVEWDDVWLGWYPFCVPINYEEVLLDLNFVEVIGNIHGGLI